MTRIATMLPLALTLLLPVGALAEEPTGAVESVVVAAEPQSPGELRSSEGEAEAPLERKVNRLVPRGSRESAAGYRFQRPYAFPEQTLPIMFPAISNISF
jgi:hypothetical protein